MSPKPSPLRLALAFALLFAVYQTAEALQTWVAPASPLGPLLMVAAALLPWPVGHWLGWRGYDAFALDARGASFAILAGGFLLALLAKFAAVFVGLAGVAYDVPPLVGFVLHPHLLAFALLSTFVPSIAEDILTRGFVLRTIGVRWKLPAFLLASAALYTLNHIWRFDWGWSEQVRLFCMGLAYAAAAWRWRTLWGAVALHWGWNFAGTFADMLLPLGAHDPVAIRLISAAVHLALLAILLLLPAVPRRDGNRPML